jgi:osmotically-inducible protein OsmY
MKANISTSFVSVVAGVAAAALLCAGPASADQPDPWITTKAKMALLTDAEAPALGINVDTVDGRVTLQGEVKSDAEKARAEKVVREIDGVRDVRNMLRVDASPDDDAAASAKVTDDDLEKRVEAAIDDDPALAKSDIDVKSVENGAVTLEGKAPTMTEHRRALEKARAVSGVASVRREVQAPGEMTDAEVWDDDDADAKEAAAKGDSGAGAAASDMWITTATKVRLMANDEAPALDINVDTRDGAVTLFGTVPSD